MYPASMAPDVRAMPHERSDPAMRSSRLERPSVSCTYQPETRTRGHIPSGTACGSAAARGDISRIAGLGRTAGAPSRNAEGVHP